MDEEEDEVRLIEEGRQASEGEEKVLPPGRANARSRQSGTLGEDEGEDEFKSVDISGDLHERRFTRYQTHKWRWCLDSVTLVTVELCDSRRCPFLSCLFRYAFCFCLLIVWVGSIEDERFFPFAVFLNQCFFLWLVYKVFSLAFFSCFGTSHD